MNLKILNEKQKEDIEMKLNEQFGIKEIPGEVIMMGKEKLFLFSGSFDKKQIKKMNYFTNIERIGIYFAKIDERTHDIRLSIEGVYILKDQIKKNIFNVPTQLVEEWMKGHELNIKTGKKGFIVMKHENDFLGSGKASEEKIGNFIPKNRRLKEKN
jgi:NOL1/NOP2/fmu family ribosome biogenesis protein